MRKTWFFATTLLISSLVLTVACSKNDSSPATTSMNTKSIIENPSLTDAEKAEQLALAAERLIYTDGIVYANQVLEQALGLDSANIRARLYSAIIRPGELQRGLRSRLSYLEIKKEGILNKVDKQLENSKNENLIAFVKEQRASDLTDERSIQKHLDQMQSSFMDIRKLAASLKNTELTLNIPKNIAEDLNRRNRYCTVRVEADTYSIEPIESNYIGTDCNFDLERKVKLNAADFEAIKQYASGSVAYLTLGNLYDADGLIDAHQKDLSRAELYKIVSTNARFGLLRSLKPLQNLKALGADYAASVRWALDRQQELCPNGYDEQVARPAHLIERAICISEATGNKNISDIANILDGKDMVVAAQINSEEINITTTPLAFFDNPIKDLKTLNPAFTNCDKVASISNTSLNGLLPNNDANLLLQKDNDCVR